MSATPPATASGQPAGRTVEAVHLRYLSAFVVSAEQCDAVWPFSFER